MEPSAAGLKKRLTTHKSTDYNATKSANYRIMITRPQITLSEWQNVLLGLGSIERNSWQASRSKRADVRSSQLSCFISHSWTTWNILWYIVYPSITSSTTQLLLLREKENYFILYLTAMLSTESYTVIDSTLLDQ